MRGHVCVLSSSERRRVFSLIICECIYLRLSGAALRERVMQLHTRISQLVSSFPQHDVCVRRKANTRTTSFCSFAVLLFAFNLHD